MRRCDCTALCGDDPDVPRRATPCERFVRFEQHRAEAQRVAELVAELQLPNVVAGLEELAQLRASKGT